MDRQVTALCQRRETASKRPPGFALSRELCAAVETWLKVARNLLGLFQNPENFKKMGKEFQKRLNV